MIQLGALLAGVKYEGGAAGAIFGGGVRGATATGEALLGRPQARQAGAGAPPAPSVPSAPARAEPRGTSAPVSARGGDRRAPPTEPATTPVRPDAVEMASPLAGRIDRPQLDPNREVSAVEATSRYRHLHPREARVQAQRDALDTIRGSHRNDDTGWDIEVSRRGIKKSLSGEQEARVRAEIVANLPALLRGPCWWILGHPGNRRRRSPAFTASMRRCGSTAARIESSSRSANTATDRGGTTRSISWKSGRPWSRGRRSVRPRPPEWPARPLSRYATCWPGSIATTARQFSPRLAGTQAAAMRREVRKPAFPIPALRPRRRRPARRMSARRGRRQCRDQLAQDAAPPRGPARAADEGAGVWLYQVARTGLASSVPGAATQLGRYRCPGQRVLPAQATTPSQEEAEGALSDGLVGVVRHLTSLRPPPPCRLTAKGERRATARSPRRRGKSTNRPIPSDRRCREDAPGRRRRRGEGFQDALETAAAIVYPGAATAVQVGRRRYLP